MLPPGRRFDHDCLIDEVLDHCNDRSAEMKKKKRSNGTFLQIDHVRPHLVQAKFDSLGIHRLSHPHTAQISHRATSGLLNMFR
jgi:hypothetical protein